jgi:hypothetical protein
VNPSIKKRQRAGITSGTSLILLEVPCRSDRIGGRELRALSMWVITSAQTHHSESVVVLTRDARPDV